MSKWTPGMAWGIAMKAASLTPPSFSMVSTEEVPVISTATPGSIAPASSAAAARNTAEIYHLC
jgi:hypothetical protein